MTFLGFLASSLNKPVAFVFGNHNLKELPRFQGGRDPAQALGIGYGTPPPSYGSTYIDGKIKRIKGIIIAGLGGSMRYNDGEHQFSEGQMRRRVFKMVPRLVFNRLFFGRYLDIFVSHAPPRSINDGEDLPHRGFEIFRWFNRTFKPRYHLHGHVHLYDLNASRETEYENTRVINVFGHYLLNYNE